MTGAASLEKALELLKRVVRDDGETPFTHFAGELGLPSSTAHRLLRTLEQHGLIVRISRGHFIGGLELANLVGMSDIHRVLIRVSRPILKKLADALKLTAHLGVLEDDMVTYLLKEDGGRKLAFTREGMQLEAYCSGIGKMLLSSLDKKKLEAYLSNGPFVALTSRTLTEPNVLRRELVQISHSRFSIDDGEVFDGLKCLAMPVFGFDGHAIAAVSVSGSIDELDKWGCNGQNALVKCVRLIEKRISRPLDGPIGR